MQRIQQNIPEYLIRVTSGQAIFNLVVDASAYSFSYDNLNSKDEVEIVGYFLQIVQDWGEIGSDLESGRRVEVAYNLSELIQELDQAGFWVFGGREVQKLEGGVLSEFSDWPVAILRIVRKENKTIKQVNFDDIKEFAIKK